MPRIATWTAQLFAIALVLASIGLRDASASDTVVVYKTPSCGCCTKWVDHLRANGFTVTVEEKENLQPIKTRLGVPRDLESCHTATVEGFFVEGHVPASDIRRLLAERPAAKGIAVPDMPIGSPGMESGDEREPYQVFLVDGDGGRTVFATHGAPAP